MLALPVLTLIGLLKQFIRPLVFSAIAQVGNYFVIANSWCKLTIEYSGTNSTEVNKNEEC